MGKGIALITGALRPSGIGRHICLALAKRSWDICFTYWSPYHDRLEPGLPDRLATEIEQSGSKSAHIELDLRFENSPGELFEFCHHALGHVAVLINNAAYSRSQSLLSLTPKSLDNHFYVNTRAPVLLTQEFVKQHRKGNRGRIINMTSGQSLGPMPNELAYTITKGGLETLTRQCSIPLYELGITVNAINPGPIDSGWMDEDTRLKLSGMFANGKIPTAEKIAGIVAFLCTDNADPITGQIIHAESGFNRIV